MTALTKLAATETRLFLRDPGTVFVAVLLPTLVLVALGSIPALRTPSETFGGGTFLDFFLPSLLAMSIAVLGLTTLPVGLATYREKGILRRLSTTPMRPAAILVGQLLINVVTAAVATGLMVVVAALAFDIPLPAHPLGFLVAFVLGTAAVFSIGLVVAAVAPRARLATGIGTVLFILTMFFAGVYLPKFLLPEPLLRISEFVPPGIDALNDAWLGGGPQPLQLAVMAVITLIAGGLAARLFRWE